MSDNSNSMNLALQMVEEGEKCAKQGLLTEAIAKLQQALTLLDQCEISEGEKNAAREMIFQLITTYQQIEQPVENQPSRESYDQMILQEKANNLEQGIQAIEHSEQLINQGQFADALNGLYFAYDKLTQAEWDSTKLQNILYMIKYLTKNIETFGLDATSGTSTQYESSITAQISPEAREEYVPSFLKSHQQDVILPGSHVKGRDTKIPENMAYSPTFLTSDQVDYTIQSPLASKRVSSASTLGADQQGKGDSGYQPTFAQTQQPDYLLPGTDRRLSSQMKREFSEPFVPTYAQVQQESVISSHNPPKPGTESGEYVPTFAQTQLSTGSQPNLDLNQLHQLFSYIQNGIPIPDELKGTTSPPVPSPQRVFGKQNKFESSAQSVQEAIPAPKPVEITAKVSSGTSSKSAITSATATPPDFSKELRHETEEIAQKLSELFEMQQNEYHALQKSIFNQIESVIPLERAYSYPDAITQLEKGIDKLNLMPGWIDQALVLYAWMLILKEKHRVQYALPDGAKVFDLARINQEFTQIMSTSLKTSDEVTISFKADMEQELIPSQIFKKKLARQEVMENQIFEALDSGNLHLSNGNYSEALGGYCRCLINLHLLGWKPLIEMVQQIIPKLYELDRLNDASLLRELPSQSLEGLSNKEIRDRQFKHSEAIAHRMQIVQQKKTYQQDYVKDAIAAIIQGEQFYQTDLYDEALDAYQRGINILIDSGWSFQILRVSDRMGMIYKERDRYIQEQQKYYTRGLDRNLQRRYFDDRVQQYIERTIDSEAKKRLNEAVQKIYQQLIIVDDHLAKQQLAELILALQTVKSTLESLEWRDLLPFIYDYTTWMQEEKTFKEETRKRKDQRALRGKNDQEKLEIYLEQQTANLLHAREQYLSQLAEFTQILQFNQKSSDDALKLMEEAERFLKRHEYTRAIGLYQEAGEIFTRVGWNVNIPAHLEKVKQMEREYLNSMALAEQEKHRKEEAVHMKQLAKEQQQTQQFGALKDIHSMLKHIDTEGSESKSPDSSTPSTTSPQFATFQKSIGKTLEHLAQSQPAQKKQTKVSDEPTIELDEIKKLLRKVDGKKKD